MNAIAIIIRVTIFYTFNFGMNISRNKIELISCIFIIKIYSDRPSNCAIKKYNLKINGNINLMFLI